jgi:hypothetical protein
MSAIAIERWLAPVTENIDMSTTGKARNTFRAVRSLVFAIGLLAGLPAQAVLTCVGDIDFCDKASDGTPLWYDNANIQTKGCFTDVIRSGWRPSDATTVTPRAPEINVFQDMAWADTTKSPLVYHSGTNPWGDSLYKPQQCGLNFYGDSLKTSDNHAEMWATIVWPPGLPSPPVLDSWSLTATIWYDNVTGAPNPKGSGGWNNGKAVGIITNYDYTNRTGLFLGLFDAGNTESLRLMKFDVSPNASVTPRLNMCDPQGGPPSSPGNNCPGGSDIAFKALVPNSIKSTGDGGSSTQSYAYVVTLSIKTLPDTSDPTKRNLDAVASVFPANTTYNQGPGNLYSCASVPPTPAPDQQCFVYHGSLPAGLLGLGAVGLATLSRTGGSGVVDTYIGKFTITGGGPGA